MNKLALVLVLTCLGSSVVHAGEIEQSWGLNQVSQGSAVVVIAVGLSPQEIYSQVGIIADGGGPIKKIVIQSPDHNIDALILDLQKRFLQVEIKVSYSK